jgi:site-specific recombinase XerD
LLTPELPCCPLSPEGIVPGKSHCCIYIPRVKGSIAKTYPLQPEDLRLVRAYLRTREDDSPYLFISTRGIPLERRSYWDLMQKYGKSADIPKSKRRFHALRHAIAVHLLDAGADVAFVQDRLGGLDHGIGHLALMRPQKNKRLNPTPG